MLQIPVSMDKLTIEFKDIHMVFFIGYILGDLKKMVFCQ